MGKRKHNGLNVYWPFLNEVCDISLMHCKGGSLHSRVSEAARLCAAERDRAPPFLSQFPTALCLHYNRCGAPGLPRQSMSLHFIVLCQITWQACPSIYMQLYVSINPWEMVGGQSVHLSQACSGSRHHLDS